MLARLTYEFLSPHTADAAIESLSTHVFEDEGSLALFLEACKDVLANPPSAKAARWAFGRVCEHLAPEELLGIIQEQLHSTWSQQRVLALSTLAGLAGDLKAQIDSFLSQCLALVAHDQAWIVRQEAILTLASIAAHEVPDDPAQDPRLRLLIAADDPHWRVRNELLGVWLRWAQHHPQVPVLCLAHLETHLKTIRGSSVPVFQGFLAYLRYRWCSFPQKQALFGQLPLVPGESLPKEQAPLLARERDWWNDDPPVLRAGLQALSDTALRKDLDALLALIVHEDQGVRRLCVRALRRFATNAQLLDLLAWCDQPRVPYLIQGCEDVFAKLNMSRREELVWVAWSGPWSSSPAVISWVLAQPFHQWIDTPDQMEEVSRWLQKCLAHRERAVCQAVCKWWFLRALENDHRACSWLADAKEALYSWIDDDPATLPDELLGAPGLLSSLIPEKDFWERLSRAPVPRLRVAAARYWSELAPEGDVLSSLRADPESRVRAKALDMSSAEAILSAPETEPSWLVREAAARLCQQPLKKAFAQVWSVQKERRPQGSWRVSGGASSHPTQALPLAAPLSVPGWWRPLGQTGLSVSPLGISGHYGLPEEGFARAVDAGINLFFWEPEYQRQTAFMKSLPLSQREALVTTCGTFEASPEAVLRDLHRALRLLGVEQIKLWLIFWTRTWERLSPALIAALLRCQEEGKIHSFGMSTHQRGLAVQAIEEGWDVVMVRHNAAHRGAEREVFPKAHSHGTGLLTFNNLIYGRILEEPYEGAPPAPSAADCYRYSLSQPGVAGSFSAPTTLEHLNENLKVLDDTSFPSEKLGPIRAFGDTVYLENRMFADCIRYRGWGGG